MTTTAIDIAAPLDAVYDALMDAWTYEVWVRGTKRIREVDATWPAIGAAFHHSVGVGPLATRDETRLLATEPNSTVELEVHIWPVGEARVRLDLKDVGSPDDPRTRVTMHEHFTRGPGAWVDNGIQQALMKVRNDWSLDKLGKIVEQRFRQTRPS